MMLPSRFFSIIGFICFAIFSRFLPHPPNCTAIQATTLFAVSFLQSVPLAYFILFMTMFMSDLFLGLHSTLFFVYFSLGLNLWIANRFHATRTLRRTFLFLTISSLLFFFITNFGVWLMEPFYPKTMTGLGLCYLAALPYLSNQIIGNFLYGTLLFRLNPFSAVAIVQAGKI